MRREPPRAAILLPLLLCFTLGACTSAAPIRWYSIDAPSPALAAPVPAAGAGSASAVTATAAVLVGPMGIPEGLDRVQMVVRVEGNRLEVLDGHRWTEPLGGLLLKGLAVRLAARLPQAQVATIADALAATKPIRVAVDVLALDAGTSSAGRPGVSMLAAWTVRGGAEDRRIAGRTNAQVPVASADYGALAQASGAALDRLADELAVAIRSADTPR